MQIHIASATDSKNKSNLKQLRNTSPMEDHH